MLFISYPYRNLQLTDQAWLQRQSRHCREDGIANIPFKLYWNPCFKLWKGDSVCVEYGVVCGTFVLTSQEKPVPFSIYHLYCPCKARLCATLVLIHFILFIWIPRSLSQKSQLMLNALSLVHEKLIILLYMPGDKLIPSRFLSILIIAPCYCCY